MTTDIPKDDPISASTEMQMRFQVTTLLVAMVETWGFMVKAVVDWVVMGVDWQAQQMDKMAPTVRLAPVLRSVAVATVVIALTGQVRVVE